jgi:hypothetical protein
MALTALAGLAALMTPVAPASALSVTTPTSAPVPVLPLPLPIAGSVSGGTGGDPIDVTVTGPGSTGIEATLPGLPSAPAGPTGSVPLPAPIASATPVVTPAPAPATPGGTADSAVSAPDDRAVARRPSASPLPAARSAAEGARPPAPPTEALPANVSAAIHGQPADSILQRVPAIASRIALWAALAGIVVVLQMLVGSAVRQRRNRTARIS